MEERWQKETNKKVWTICCSKDDDVPQWLHAVHLGEHLAQHARDPALAGGITSVSNKTIDLILFFIHENNQ